MGVYRAYIEFRKQGLGFRVAGVQYYKNFVNVCRDIIEGVLVV